MKLLWLIGATAVLSAALVLTGCDDDDDDSGDDDAGDDDSGDDDSGDDDFGPTRPFYMAAAPYQYEFLEFDIRDNFDTTGFDGRVDMLSLHMDFWGLPWDAFMYETDLPPAWVAKMAYLRQLAVDLNVPVYLSVTPLGGLRDRLSDNVRDMGPDLVKEPFGEECQDVVNGPLASEIRAAYVQYVLWMINYFKPEILTHVIELDMFDMWCPETYESMIVLANEAYDAVKTRHPGLVTFPTFTMAHMWGIDEGTGCDVGDRDCLAASLARNAAVKRDRFGISSYPMFQQYRWEWVPADYFSTVTDLTGETIVFGETGYGSRPVIIPWPGPEDPCQELFSMSDADQIAYLEFLFSEAEAAGSDLVCWWSLREFMPAAVHDSCPCDAPGNWCLLYDAFREIGMLHAWLGWGSMGIIDYDLNEKASAAAWGSWLSRPRR